ncbi:MAG: hypothetical protein ACLUW6_04875 [Coriobacteriaceae bacterium]
MMAGRRAVDGGRGLGGARAVLVVQAISLIIRRQSYVQMVVDMGMTAGTGRGS